MGDIYSVEKSAYPHLLRTIPKAPPYVRVRGALPTGEHLKWLAVVGSRSMTRYGEQALRHLMQSLAGQPIVIVSGLAYGVDVLAHRLALEIGLPTVAVPGSGLDWNVLYPKMHVRFAKELLDKGNALVSEFPDSTASAIWTFPQRNRIMAGLSHATLVIEAQKESGSLITAQLAADFNRDVLVVPGSIFSEQSYGTHQFLKLGATPVTEPNDILRALGLSESSREVLRTDLTHDELRVLDIVATPRTKDALFEMLNIPITDAQVLLSMMELKSLIVEEVGYVRRA